MTPPCWRTPCRYVIFVFGILVLGCCCVYDTLAFHIGCIPTGTQNVKGHPTTTTIFHDRSSALHSAAGRQRRVRGSSATSTVSTTQLNAFKFYKNGKLVREINIIIDRGEGEYGEFPKVTPTMAIFPTATEVNTTATADDSTSASSDVCMQLDGNEHLNATSATGLDSTSGNDDDMQQQQQQPQQQQQQQEEEGSEVPTESTETIPATVEMENTQVEKAQESEERLIKEEADIVIIGGGVSGLTAAISAVEAFQKKKINDTKIVLLEATDAFGGRVASETTEDGFVLDKGFAVFIEEYPFSKLILDYDDLKLRRFLPGALVKMKGQNRLARISDPLRERSDVFQAITSPIGTPGDKLAMLPLILNVRYKSIEELFEEFETDTETALRSRWGFSDDIINKFFKPFLEGIYLTPLSEQSSRMFSFVMKMFSEGAATLPKGGMQAVTDQLVNKAKTLGVKLRTNSPVSSIELVNDTDGQSLSVNFAINSNKDHTLPYPIKAKSVIVATDGQVAQRLISNIDGFESLEYLPEQPQRSVGCVYYTFEGDAPVSEPILVLNGIGEEFGNPLYPVNNICFPSVVNDGYAPKGKSLCSVAVLSDVMDFYEHKEDELDLAVRQQLSTWFPDLKQDIIETWELKKIYNVSDDTLI